MPRAPLPRREQDLTWAAALLRRENVGLLTLTGAGVGLYGARQIVEQHGGTIGVRSREGGGSTFTIRRPLEHANGASEVLLE